MRIRDRQDALEYRPPWRLMLRPIAYALAAIGVWLWATATLPVYTRVIPMELPGRTL